MSPLSESIKKTLAYFSLFNFPLTKEELFAYLWQPPRLGFDEFIQFMAAFTGSELREKYGYFFLAGAADAADPVENRRRRAIVSEQKLKIAGRAVRKIRSVPFLRAVFVCNSVGSGLAKRESDIDFFIITAPRRIWLVRFFTNLILKIFGLRTYGGRSRNKICLSFFADENSLNLQPLCAAETDIHFAYWLNQMIPLYDPRDFYGKFLSSNRWALKYIPNAGRKSSGRYLLRIADSKLGGGWKNIWEIMWGKAYGDLLENQVKAIQAQRFRPSIKEAAARKDNCVVFNDGVLKFHENDTRREILEKWKTIAA